MYGVKKRLVSGTLAATCLITGWYYARLFSDATIVGLRRGVPIDLFPLWNGVRTTLAGGNPYDPALTLQNDLWMYGASSQALGLPKSELFAYPLIATPAVALLEVFDFQTASNLAFIVFAVLVALSIGWFRRKWDGTTVLYCVLALGTYPVIFDLQSRQPTLLFFGLAMMSYALLRCDRPLFAGLVAALALGKPHVAAPILLPMFLWSMRRDRRFALYMIGSALAVSAGFLLLDPHWISAWFHSMRAYARIMSQPSIVVAIFGHAAGGVISAVTIVALIGFLWAGKLDWSAQIALSTLVFILVLPWQFYNSILLLLPTIWAVDNAERLSGMSRLGAALLKVALVEYWAAISVAAMLFNTRLNGLAMKLSSVMLIPIIMALVFTLGFWLITRQYRESLTSDKLSSLP